MMNVSQIKEFTESISDIIPLGKSFSVGGFELELAGFFKQDGKDNILFLVYNEELRELIDEYNAEAAAVFDLDTSPVPTMREEELRNLRADIEFPHIKEIEIGSKRLPIKFSRHSLLSNNETEHALLIAEFIRSGWFSERFAHINPDNLFIMICCPAEAPANINTDGNIKISFAAERKTFPAQIPLILKINGETQKFVLPCGESVFIRNVQPFDLHRHTEEVFASEKIRNAFSPEKLEERRRSTVKTNEEICPKGKCFLTVEYEAPENVSLRIIPKSTLDSPRSRSNGAFGVIISASDEAKHEGYKVKCETISQPFEPDIESIEAEIFSYTVTTPIKDMTI